MKQPFIPFKLTSSPMKKLALINFENDPDEFYRGLELQYFDGLPYGKGWRIIAYRNDKYVDVYDDLMLNFVENERFDVAEKGLMHHTKAEIHGVRFDKDEYGVHICFSFKDRAERDIIIRIHEYTKRKSKPMNLLAPIGAGSSNPTYLPLYFLYEFDFVRKGKTEIHIEIDGKLRKADNFPFPITKELQWRYYTRYSMDCHMIDFAESEDTILSLVELEGDDSYTHGLTRYNFDSDEKKVSLKSILLNDEKNPVELTFDKPLPIISELDEVIEGKFSVRTKPIMGTIHGTYRWKKAKGICSISISPNGGWTSVPNSFLTRIILGPKSIFCTWPMTYRYRQKINMNSLKSRSEWTRI
ncbi:MAG: hypothetical protein ACOX77_10495 [Caldicoprobacterales bacterium]|jgi:hypothetical protein